MKKYFILFISLLFIAPAAFADSLAFNTSDSQFDAGINNQGWYNASIGSSDNNDNYAVSNSSGAYRNFLTFDLSALADTVIAATLELTRFQNSGNVTLEFHEITTAAAALNDNSGSKPGVYADLADGPLYGSFAVTAGAETDVLSFSLNAAAISAINVAAGGFFSIGGSLNAAGGSGYMFFGSGGSGRGVQRLTLETSGEGGGGNNEIPEPATMLLLGAGLCGMGVRRKHSA